jgi:hypothetical protein
MKTLILAASLLALPLSSQATTVFSDDFESDTVGLNKTTFNGGWTVLSGAVDLIGNGFFDFIPSNGKYVDLDGSTGSAGGFDKQVSLAANTNYTLSFDLAGSQRGDSNIVDVIFGTTTASYTLNSSDPFSTYTLSFLTNGAADYQIFFKNRGGDNVGALLDKVKVEVSAVPLPAALPLLTTALGLFGLSRRKV